MTYTETIEDAKFFLKGKEINGVIVKGYVTIDLYVKNVYSKIPTDHFCEFIIDKILSYSKVIKVNSILLRDIRVANILSNEIDTRFELKIESNIISCIGKREFPRNNLYTMHINIGDVKSYMTEKRREKRINIITDEKI